MRHKCDFDSKSWDIMLISKIMGGIYAILIRLNREG